MLICRSFDFASIKLSKVLLGRNRKYVTHTFSSNRADSLCKCVGTQISHAGKVNFKKAKSNTVKDYKINLLRSAQFPVPKISEQKKVMCILIVKNRLSK